MPLLLGGTTFTSPYLPPCRTCTTLGSRHSTASRSENTPCGTNHEHARWDDMRVTGGPSIICAAFALSVYYYYINALRDTPDDVMGSLRGLYGAAHRPPNKGVCSSCEFQSIFTCLDNWPSNLWKTGLTTCFPFFLPILIPFPFPRVLFFSPQLNSRVFLILLMVTTGLQTTAWGPGPLCAECAIKLNNASSGMH